MDALEMRRTECQMQILQDGFWIAFVIPEKKDITKGRSIEVFANGSVAKEEFLAKQIEYGRAKFGKFSITSDGDLQIVPTDGILNFEVVVEELNQAGMFTSTSPDFVANTLNENQRVQLFSEIVTGAIIVDQSQGFDTNA